MRRPRYSAFRHLRHSLFWKPHDWIGMVTINCDDSGRSPENRVAVVAGYIGSTRLWERFEKAWQPVLAKEGVRVLHRSDLENFYGEFTEEKGWNPTRRTAFLKKLHPIIKDFTYCAVGMAVIKADFEAVMPDVVKVIYGGPFGWCAFACIAAARNWCDYVGHREPIQWVFEAGTVGAREIGRMFQALYESPEMRRDYRVQLGGYSFQPKTVVPLQSADVVAYEVFKQMENGVIDQYERYPMRKSMLDLFREVDIPRLQYWDCERLEKWAAQWTKRSEGQEEVLARAVEAIRKGLV